MVVDSKEDDDYNLVEQEEADASLERDGTMYGHYDDVEARYGEYGNKGPGLVAGMKNCYGEDLCFCDAWFDSHLLNPQIIFDVTAQLHRTS